MSHYPALEIERADHELALAVVDDYGPLAAEERGLSLLVFFPTSALRDQARAAVTRAMPHAAAVARDVDDEDWARRSQEGLEPVQVGSITIASPSADGRVAEGGATASSPGDRLVILIQPSMGFGTGHHATTRLCLAALQTLDLRHASVLDVGTGSGVLAIAARRRGAAPVVGIDDDPDALESARRNLPLNPAADQVTFELLELGRDPLAPADLVIANLTGALLRRTAPLLIGMVNAGGHLIVSGLMRDERDGVRAAFETMALVWEAAEDEWVGLCFERPIPAPPRDAPPGAKKV